MLLILIVVCVAVALCQYGVSLAVRHGRRPRWLLLSPRTAAVATAVAIVIALPIAVAAGAPGEAKDRWDNFKSRSGGSAHRQPDEPGPQHERERPLPVLAVRRRRL